MSSKPAYKDSTKAQNIASDESSDMMDALKLVLSRVYGKEAQVLFDYILNNGYVAEETISNTTGVRSNEGRRILQKMSEEAIIVPGKLRTENGTLHIWKLNEPALKLFLLNRLRKAKENLELLLKYSQENQLYECPKCKRVFSADNAYALDLTCPHDGELLQEFNVSKYAEELKNLIWRINSAINSLERIKVAKTKV
ncbi:MAG: transcription factor TFIIE [Desulfurococcaceae archaeon]